MEHVRSELINTSKIPLEIVPATPIAAVAVERDSLADSQKTNSGQVSVEKELPEYKKPFKVAVEDRRMKTTKKADTPKTNIKWKKSVKKLRSLLRR